MKEQNANRGEKLRHPYKKIADTKAAHVLAHRGEARFLEPFFGREQNLRDAAAELGLSVKALYPKVKRLETLGLVQVTRSEPRAGKAVKYYRSTADDFFVPAHVLPVEVGLTKGEMYWQQRMRRSILAAWLKQPGEASELGLRVVLTSRGRMQFIVAPDPDKVKEKPQRDSFASELPIVYQWRTVRLSKTQAQRLQSTLEHLLESYTLQREGETYIVRLAMAPLVEE
jgi:hypothetical protein